MKTKIPTVQAMIEAYAINTNQAFTINKAKQYWRVKGNTVYYMTTCVAELLDGELIVWPWNYPGLR